MIIINTGYCHLENEMISSKLPYPPKRKRDNKIDPSTHSSSQPMIHVCDPPRIVDPLYFLLVIKYPAPSATWPTTLHERAAVLLPEAVYDVEKGSPENPLLSSRKPSINMGCL
ncbi:hypothetical protein Ancab_016004 [Ancistrocladus abbreviatus]